MESSSRDDHGVVPVTKLTVILARVITQPRLTESRLCQMSSVLKCLHVIKTKEFACLHGVDIFHIYIYMYKYCTWLALIFQQNLKTFSIKQVKTFFTKKTQYSNLIIKAMAIQFNQKKKSYSFFFQLSLIQLQQILN